MRSRLGFVALAICTAALWGCKKEGDTIIIQQVAGTPPPPPPPPFAITGSDPAGGTTAGGTAVLITGTSIASGATVSFGGVAAASVTFISSTALSAVTPAGTGTVDIAVSNPGGPTLTLTAAFTYDSPPTLGHTLPANTVAKVGDELQFSVTATEPGGNNVHLRLLNPPPGCICVPAVNATSPATVNVRWAVGSMSGGYRELVFRAEDATSGATALVQVPCTVIGGVAATGTVVSDVTGDGVLDVVVGARSQDGGGFLVNVGAVHVWSGQQTPTGAPSATLMVSGATGGAMLGAITGQGIQCADVTGDGINDVVVGASAATAGGVGGAGAIYVWAGGTGLTGTPAPTATLEAGSPQVGDALGSSTGQSVLLCDVSGDGQIDVVAGTSRADVGGVADAGAVYMWTGGSAMTGTRTPTATLTVTSPTANDRLGHTLYGQGVVCCDVTGDGTADLVVGAILADDPGGPTVDVGRVYFWQGGSTLTGALAPNAVLVAPSPVASDQMGQLGFTGGCGIVCCDVTGNGNNDIIVGASLADTNVVNGGEICVWAGGALTGTLTPTTTIAPTATAQDQLGSLGGQGILCCEVTGDSKLDLVSGSYLWDTSVADAGRLYVWAGTTGTISATPTATLELGTPTAQDYLGYTGSGARTVRCCEVTGDATDDLLVAGYTIDGTVANSGAIVVWAGGTGMTGTPAPTAFLEDASAGTSDLLGYTFNTLQLPFVCCDLTGDGQDDVVGIGFYADAGGVTNCGSIFVWAGGTGLTGSPTPTAQLYDANATAWDQLGLTSGLGVICADVTGDGTADAIVGGYSVDAGGVLNRGALYVWAGGTGMTGTPTHLALLTAPVAANDYVGFVTGRSILVAETTGDGILDVVTGATWADVSGVPNAGAMFMWAGGTALTGAPTATATLTTGVGATYIQRSLGGAFGQGIHLADYSGDGVVDIIGSAPASDANTIVTGVGAQFLWNGGAGLTGNPLPTGVLMHANPYLGDALGN